MKNKLRTIMTEVQNFIEYLNTPDVKNTILSREQAQKYVDIHKRITDISIVDVNEQGKAYTKALVFVDSNTFDFSKLPCDFVQVTTRFPLRTKSQEVADGIVKSIDDYSDVFCDKDQTTMIESVEDLLQYMKKALP